MLSEEQLANALVQKIAHIVLGSDDIVGIPTPTRSFISFCYPGIAVDATDFEFGFIAPGANAGSAAADFADLVNSIPAVQGRFMPTAEKITDIYAEILRDKQLPQVELTADEKVRLQKATALLKQEIVTIDDATGGTVIRIADTPLYEKYKELELAYIAEGLKYRSLQLDMLFRGDDRSKTEWALKGNLLRQMVQSAYNNWSTVKGAVEIALGTIEALSSRGPETYWLGLRDRFDKSKFSTPEGEDYYYTKYFPGKFWDTAHAAGWANFKMTHGEVHTINESSQMSTSLKGGFSSGLWSVGGSGSYAEQKSRFKSDNETASVELQLTMAPIRRTWLDASVFANRAWRLDPNINKALFSDGGSPPQGRMPALITGMILGRGLKLGIDMSTTENKAFASQLTVSASAGWGPFSVRGNYTRNTDRKTHDFVQSTAGIEAPGLQILGFVCQMLPKSPNPDDTLNWPDDE
jgi:hypothetical protein